MTRAYFWQEHGLGWTRCWLQHYKSSLSSVCSELLTFRVEWFKNLYSNGYNLVFNTFLLVSHTADALRALLFQLQLVGVVIIHLQSLILVIYRFQSISSLTLSGLSQYGFTYISKCFSLFIGYILHCSIPYSSKYYIFSYNISCYSKYKVLLYAMHVDKKRNVVIPQVAFFLVRLLKDGTCT